MSEQKSEVYIEQYSEKSFVIRGDTRPYRESLRALGGKWANRLTDKETNEKFGAWLFWSKKHPELVRWIKGGCKPVEGSGGGSIGTGLEGRIGSMEATLCRLEKMIQVLHNYILNGEIIEEEEEEEEEKPKRLLGK
jgi:hypothetical protein